MNRIHFLRMTDGFMKATNVRNLRLKCKSVECKEEQQSVAQQKDDPSRMNNRNKQAKAGFAGNRIYVMAVHK